MPDAKLGGGPRPSLCLHQLQLRSSLTTPFGSGQEEQQEVGGDKEEGKGEVV